MLVISERTVFVFKLGEFSFPLERRKTTSADDTSAQSDARNSGPVGGVFVRTPGAVRLRPFRVTSALATRGFAHCYRIQLRLYKSER